MYERPWITADADTSGHSVRSQRKFGCSLPSCGIQRVAQRTCHIYLLLGSAIKMVSAMERDEPFI